MVSVAAPDKSIILARTAFFAFLAAAGYFLLATTTIALTSEGDSIATVWPADAIVLALLVTRPRRYWPAILLAGWAANFAANGLTRGWSAGILAYGAINMAQVLIAAQILMRPAAKRKGLLEDGPSVVRFILGAGLIAPAFGSLCGSAVSWLIYDQPFLVSFGRWMASNALGMLVFTPFLAAILDGSYARCFGTSSRLERLERIALLAVHGALTAFVFMQSHYPLLFMPFASLLLITFRLGRLGTKLGVVILAIGAALSALYNSGPMVLIGAPPEMNAIFMQVYLAIMLATALPVAAIVSSRSEALARLAEREASLRFFMSHSTDCLLEYDANGICRWADGAVHPLLGAMPDELVGTTLDEFLSTTGGHSLSRIARPVDGATWNRTIESVPIRRPMLTIEASFRSLFVEGEILGTVVTIRDVSERKARERSITRRAETDPLTEILNRAGFDSKTDAMLKSSHQPLCLALIDIDHFKTINDSYGHPVGDAVLVEIARRLDEGTKNCDLVGRLGGDEFAILFACDLETAHNACQRIARAIAAKPIYFKDTLRIATTLSCGLAAYRPGWTRDNLVAAADSALYEVKRAGRNGVRIHDGTAPVTVHKQEGAAPAALS